MTERDKKTGFDAIGLIARRDSPQVVESLHVVEKLLVRAGARVLLDEHTARLMGASRHETITQADLKKRCDLVVVVGGDGSLLGVARTLAPSRVPLLGVNRGGLGFLADIAPGQIETALTEVLEGAYQTEHHFLLQARVERDGVLVSESLALNDVVIHAGSMARMMELALYIDGEYVYEQRSDGLIIASPTGSTAYSLSAGGPIMPPGLEAMVVVPMFPHTLTSRPLVVDSKSDIEVLIAPDTPNGAKVSCDSQVEMDLRGGDRAIVRRSKHSVRMLYTVDHNFYESCRSKLDWGSRLGGSSGGPSDDVSWADDPDRR